MDTFFVLLYSSCSGEEFLFYSFFIFSYSFLHEFSFLCKIWNLSKFKRDFLLVRLRLEASNSTFFSHQLIVLCNSHKKCPKNEKIPTRFFYTKIFGPSLESPRKSPLKYLWHNPPKGGQMGHIFRVWL